jgi:hypothetical protein
MLILNGISLAETNIYAQKVNKAAGIIFQVAILKVLVRKLQKLQNLKLAC